MRSQRSTQCARTSEGGLINDFEVLGAYLVSPSLYCRIVGRPDMVLAVVEDLATPYILYSGLSYLSCSLDYEFLPSIPDLNYASYFLIGARFYPNPVSTLGTAFFLATGVGIDFLATKEGSFGGAFCI